MTQIVPYHESLLSPWADLHNAVFAGQHNFWPVTARLLKRRVVGAPGFDPDLLLFATDHDRLIGFAHGGEARGPELYNLGVHPLARRGGTGSALLAALQTELGPMRPDCRGMNAFWGNSRGPETSFFGMVEGIGIAQDDGAATAFLARHGFAAGPQAVNLRVTSQSMDLEPGRDARKRAETLGLELGMLRGRCPIVGQSANAEQPLSGQGWFTAVALQAGVVAGYALGFPTPELGPGRFGIFALEVEPEHRRKGIGTALVMQLLLEMQSGRFTACEVTTVPAESQGALELYERLGFAECARFALFD